jgi:rare lipoprotein A
VDQRKATLKAAAILLSMAAILPASMAHAQQSSSSGKVLQSGRASWYGPGFHGRKTASGETFNTNELTAAHRTLPFGTRVRVVNQRTGRSVVVRINDRGPYAHGRVIDLSRASAQAIGLSGVGSVTVAAL